MRRDCRKIKRFLLTLFFISMITAAQAGTTMTALHYKAIYNHGKISYDLILGRDTIYWKKLSSNENNKQEKNKVKHVNIANAIEILQWYGKDHSVNTLIVDHEHLKFVYSGFNKKQSSLEKGTLERVVNVPRINSH